MERIKLKEIVLVESLKKSVAIINPTANRGRSKAIWNQIKPTLLGQGLCIREMFTEKPFHAQKLTSEGLYDGNDIVFAIGGDGTINEVVNGFFSNDKPINENALLGVVRTGSCSDFAKTLQDESKKLNSETIVYNKDVNAVDVACVTYQNDDGNELRRYFINVADVGIGATTVEKVEKTYKKFGGKLGFFLGTLATVARYKNKHFEVLLDNQIHSDKYSAIIMANGKYFGGGMKVAPNAKLDNGLLNVITVGDLGKAEFIFNMLKVYSGKHLYHPNVKSYEAKNIRISAPDNFFVETDGEYFQGKTVEFSVLPKGIRVVLI